MAADSGGEFERAFICAVQYALDTGFTEILEFKPVQEQASLHFVKRDVFALLLTGCRKSSIFQLVPKVCEYIHAVADLGEGPGGAAPPPPYFGRKKKK